MTPRLFKPSYLLWTVPVAAIWLSFHAFGLPHVISSYTWRDNGHGMSLSVPRIYVRCRFVGPYGEFDVPATAGNCAWVRFFHREMR